MTKLVSLFALTSFLLFPPTPSLLPSSPYSFLLQLPLLPSLCCCLPAPSCVFSFICPIFISISLYFRLDKRKQLPTLPLYRHMWHVACGKQMSWGMGSACSSLWASNMQLCFDFDWTKFAAIACCRRV